MFVRFNLFTILFGILFVLFVSNFNEVHCQKDLDSLIIKMNPKPVLEGRVSIAAPDNCGPGKILDGDVCKDTADPHA